MADASHLDYQTLIRWSAKIVSEQARCSLDDALLLMQEHAASADRTMEEVAVAVLDRLVQFDG